ncbi:hypothetical protein KIPB_009876, partial [Kipferlia bialata]
ASVQRPAVSS